VSSIEGRIRAFVDDLGSRIVRIQNETVTLTAWVADRTDPARAIIEPVDFAH